MTICRYKVELKDADQGHLIESFHAEVDLATLAGLSQSAIECLVCERVRQSHTDLDGEYPDAVWVVTPPSALAHA